ncbi:unnamed protein product [Phaeothamnion confervicola]
MGRRVLVDPFSSSHAFQRQPSTPDRRCGRVTGRRGNERRCYSVVHEEEDDDVVSISFRKAVRDFARRVRETLREKKSRSGTADLRYLAGLVISEKAILLASGVTLVLAACCEVAVPHYSSRALNAVAFAKDAAAFSHNVRGMIAFSLLSSFFTGLRGSLFWLAGAHVVARVRCDLFASLLSQDVSFFDNNETGALTSRLSSDTTKISNVVSFHVNIIVRQAIQAVGGLCYLFWLSPPLASIAAVGLFAVAALTNIYGNFSRRISKQVQTALADAGSVAEQSLSLVRVVRAHSNERHERRRYAAKVERSLELQETQGLAYGCARLLIGWANAAALVAVLAAGAHHVFAGTMTGEALTSFFFYFSFVSNASFDVGDQVAKIQEALGGGQAVFDLLAQRKRPSAAAALPAAMKNGETAYGGAALAPAAAAGDATRLPVNGASVSTTVGAAATGASSLGGHIVFRHVYFSYPGRPGVLVLKGLDLEIQPGRKVAIVGASGGGKRWAHDVHSPLLSALLPCWRYLLLFCRP